MPVDGLESFDLRVVVELAGLPRRVDDGSRADEQVGQRRLAALLEVGIEPPLDRIDVIGGDELARPALEHRIVGEQDSRLDADRPGAAAVGDLGQGDRGVRHHAGGRGEVVELVEPFEDDVGDAARVEVGDLLGIEDRDVGQGEAQDLGLVGAGEGRLERGDDQQRGGEAERGAKA